MSQQQHLQLKMPQHLVFPSTVLPHTGDRPIHKPSIQLPPPHPHPQPQPQPNMTHQGAGGITHGGGEGEAARVQPGGGGARCQVTGSAGVVGWLVGWVGGWVGGECCCLSLLVEAVQGIVLMVPGNGTFSALDN